MEKNNSLKIKNFVMTLFLLWVLPSSYGVAREQCNYQSIDDDEVVVREFTDNSCVGISSFGIEVRDARDSIRACGGYPIPDGYTIQSTDTFVFACSRGVNNQQHLLRLNQPPQVEPYSASIPVDFNLIGQLTATDPEGDPITFFDINASFEGGDITIYENGVFSYTPPLGFEGLDGFTVNIRDSKGGTHLSVTHITVEGEPGLLTIDTPVRNLSGASCSLPMIFHVTNESGEFLNNDDLVFIIDPNTPPLFGSLVQQRADGTPIGNGGYRYVVDNANYAGTDNFGLLVTDTFGDSGGQLITLNISSSGTCDLDQDTLSHDEELVIGTSPFTRDTDGDQIPDDFEHAALALNPLNPNDALSDYDGDNINNLDEYLNGTDPDISDLPPPPPAPPTVPYEQAWLIPIIYRNLLD